MKRARAAANYVRHFFPEGHRGAFEQGDDIILYGIDEYSTNQKARKTVETLKTVIGEYGIKAVEFGLSNDGVAWALVAKPDADHIVDPDDLHAEVWTCWTACDDAQRQEGECDERN